MYDPSPPSSVDPLDLSRYTYDELQRIRDAINVLSEGSPTMLDISQGLPGYSYINKFGRNADVDTTLEDIWDGGGTYNFSTTADITHAVSSSASDTFIIEVQGLDTNWDLVTQNVTLTGTTAVALTTPLIRVFRARNVSATAAIGILQVGVGTTTGSFSAANLRAQISIGFEQTLMAIYTVPRGKTAYATNHWASVNKSGGAAGAVDVSVYVRTFGGVFRIGLTEGIGTTGTAVFQHEWEPYPAVAEKSDIRMAAVGSTNNFDVSAGFDIILVDN